MATTPSHQAGHQRAPGIRTRREVLRAGAGSLALLALAGCNTSLAAPRPSPTAAPTTATDGSAKGASSDELPPVKIGYLPLLDATPLLVAHARGFFAEEGLLAEPPTLVRSWSQLSEAFMAGSVNLVHLLFPIPIYMRYNLGYPAKVVAWNHMNGSALTVSQKAGIQSLDDLGGKQIAVPFWYSQHNVVLQKSLRSVGLEPIIQDRTAKLGPRQVNLFVMNPPDMPTALQSGSIDGYTVAEPFNAAGELLAGGKILRFNGDIWRNHPCCVAVLHEESLLKRPEWSQRVLNALVKAQLWSGERKAEAAKLLSKEGRGYLPTGEAVVTRAMTKYDLETYGISGGTGAIQHADWKSARISFQPYPFPSATELLTKLLKETQLEGETRFVQDLDPKRVVADLVDYRLVGQAVEKVGGLARFPDAGGTESRAEEFAV